jgi:hypothetical protein
MRTRSWNGKRRIACELQGGSLTAGDASGKADYLSRLAKIHGQVRGLQRPGDRGDLDHHVGE